MPGRRLSTFSNPPGVPNSLSRWAQARNPVRVALNFLVIQTARVCPSLAAKRFLYRCIGMRVGRGVSVGAMATFDFFFPDRLELAEGCTIGFDATVLAHEFLQGEWRLGRTRIGKNALVGACSVVLAGADVGDNATVSALSLVDRPVPDGAFAKGNPIRITRKGGRRRGR